MDLDAEVAVEGDAAGTGVNAGGSNVLDKDVVNLAGDGRGNSLTGAAVAEPDEDRRAGTFAVDSSYLDVAEDATIDGFKFGIRLGGNSNGAVRRKRFNSAGPVVTVSVRGPNFFDSDERPRNWLREATAVNPRRNFGGCSAGQWEGQKRARDGSAVQRWRGSWNWAAVFRASSKSHWSGCAMALAGVVRSGVMARASEKSLFTRTGSASTPPRARQGSLRRLHRRPISPTPLPINVDLSSAPSPVITRSTCRRRWRRRAWRANRAKPGCRRAPRKSRRPKPSPPAAPVPGSLAERAGYCRVATRARRPRHLSASGKSSGRSPFWGP